MKKNATLFFAVLLLSSSAFAFNQSHLDMVKNKQSCIKCDLSGAKLWFMKMNGLDLRGTNFSGAKFLYTEMKGANLENANFSNGQVNAVRYHNSNLKNANFKNSIIWANYAIISFYKKIRSRG